MFAEEPPSEYFYDSVEASEPLYWIKIKRAQLPPLRFDCGLSDSLLESNRGLHAVLIAEKIPHIYQEFPGEHGWLYWQEHISDTLLFVEAIMRQREARSSMVQQR